jgi:hypothetical protein
MGQVNLGLDLFRASMGGTRRSARTVPLAGATEMGANFVCLMVFERTGMRLLLGDAHFGQYIENRFAFNFQLPG